MPKSLHAALSAEAEDENISLNTYIVTLLSERHVERMLLNKIEAFGNLIETTNLKEFSSPDNRIQASYKVEESGKKYRSKKQIK